MWMPLKLGASKYINIEGLGERTVPSLERKAQKSLVRSVCDDQGRETTKVV